MDQKTLQEIRNKVRDIDPVLVKCLQMMEEAKVFAANAGKPYFELYIYKFGDEVVSDDTIENMFDVLRTEGFDRIYFSYPSQNGYGREWIRYIEDNFKNMQGYGTTVRVYF